MQGRYCGVCTYLLLGPQGLCKSKFAISATFGVPAPVFLSTCTLDVRPGDVGRCKIQMHSSLFKSTDIPIGVRSLSSLKLFGVGYAIVTWQSTNTTDKQISRALCVAMTEAQFISALTPLIDSCVTVKSRDMEWIFAEPALNWEKKTHKMKVTTLLTHFALHLECRDTRPLLLFELRLAVYLILLV